MKRKSGIIMTSLIIYLVGDDVCVDSTSAIFALRMRARTSAMLI